MTTAGRMTLRATLLSLFLLPCVLSDPLLNSDQLVGVIRYLSLTLAKQSELLSETIQRNIKDVTLIDVPLSWIETVIRSIPDTPEYKQALAQQSACGKCLPNRPDPLSQRLLQLLSNSNDYTVEELAFELSVPISDVLMSLTTNECYKIISGFFRHELTATDMRNRVEKAVYNLQQLRDDPTIPERLLTIDEKSFRLEPCGGEKVSIIVAFYQSQLIAFRLIADTSVKSSDIIFFLQNEVASSISKLRIRRPVLLWDSASWHIASDVQQAVTTLRLSQLLSHPVNSFDMNPVDQQGFHLIRRRIRGRRFVNADDLHAGIRQAQIFINSGTYFTANLNIKKTYEKCISRGGSYID